MHSEIALIRHGITEGNIRRLYYGATNVPLAQKGIDELKRLRSEGVYPSGENAMIYTTGMGRTAHTLQLIYGDVPHEIIKDLREINFGVFEMKTYEELMEYEEYRDWITAMSDTKAPPNGESIREFNERVIRGFEKVREANSLRALQLRHRGKNARSIVICHGGTISSIMNYLWPGVHDNMYEWLPNPGHGYMISFEDNIAAGHERF